MNKKCELHCHSIYSGDSHLSLEAIIAECQKKKISILALTDHGEISGALQLQKIAPDWLKVIVGEEIKTKEGDIIGLFLTKQIENGLSMKATIQAIRQQKGLVILPHPFDRVRQEAVGLSMADEIKSQIDFIEVYNSRCIFPQDNQRAEVYAKENSLSGCVGSDTHIASEIGNAVNIIDSFKNVGEFKENLRKASFQTKHASPLVHVKTKWDKIIGKSAIDKD